MHTVVVGGGFAGVKAALEIAKKNIGKVTLISDESYFLHHATLYATATGRNKAESVIPLNEIFASHANVTVVKDRITQFDASKKTVCGTKEYHYDTLIIAIGMVTNYFGIPGMAERSYGIKTLEQVTKFHTHIRSKVIAEAQLDKNYVIIGAGPTGVELAAALHDYLVELCMIHKVKRSAVRVTLIEAADRILPRSSKTASRIVTARLQKMGIKALTGQAVTMLDKNSVVSQRTTIQTQTAVWTSGVANNPFFAAHPETFTLASNGRVKVDAYLSVQPSVYVLGDNTDTKHTGMAFPALDHATFIADHLARKVTGRPLRVYRGFKPPIAIPVGQAWGYVEWGGVYVAGKTGHLVRRLIELFGYKSLLEHRRAVAAWRAHDIPETNL